MPPILTIRQAMARQEGFYDGQDTLAKRNNNPGNIRAGAFATSVGATGSDSGFAIFPTPETGFAAMATLLLLNYVGLTYAEVISKWAPSTENNTEAYINNVCAWTGNDSTTVLTEGMINA